MSFVPQQTMVGRMLSRLILTGTAHISLRDGCPTQGASVVSDLPNPGLSQEKRGAKSQRRLRSTERRTQRACPAPLPLLVEGGQQGSRVSWHPSPVSQICSLQLSVCISGLVLWKSEWDPGLAFGPQSTHPASPGAALLCCWAGPFVPPPGLFLFGRQPVWTTKGALWAAFGPMNGLKKEPPHSFSPTAWLLLLLWICVREGRGHGGQPLLGCPFPEVSRGNLGAAYLALQILAF